MTTTRRPTSAMYWRLVQDCLVAFYGFPAKQASASTAATRKRLRELGVKTGPSDMIYHSEPIDVASDIAREPFPSVPDFREQYEKLKSARERLQASAKVRVLKRSRPEKNLLASPQEDVSGYAYSKQVASVKR